MLATAQPFPLYLDTDGSPLDGGAIYIGAANADPQSSPVTVYWDAAGTQPAAQPIATLNGYAARAGAPALVYVSGDYSLRVRDRLGAQVVYVPSALTADNGLALQAQIDTLAQAIDRGISVVVGDGVTNNAAAVAAANALGKPILFTGVSVIGSPVTITAPIVDTQSQIFSTGSQVTIASGQPVRPEWFELSAGCIPRAIAALPVTGGVVQLEARTYPPSGYAYGYAGAGNCISKTGVRLRGAKMPKLSVDCKALEGGTIIQGTLLGYADALEISDLGVDCGKNVCDTLYGGAPQDTLMLTYPNDAVKAAAELRRGLRLHNIIGLAYSPVALVHAVIIAEGYGDVTATGDVIGCMGVHGAVIKASGVHVEQISAYCNGGEGVIIKSAAQATAQAGNVQIGRIVTRANGPDGTTPHAVATTGYGLLFHAEGGSIDKIQIGSASFSGHPQGLAVLYGSASYTIANIEIGQITTDLNATCGLNLTAGGYLERWQIGSAVFRNTTIGATFQFNNPGVGTPNHVSVAQLTTVNASDVSVAIGSQSYVDIGQHVATNCGKVYRINDTPKLQVGSLSPNNTPVVYDTAFSGLAPALSNSWTEVASSDPFGVDLLGGRAHLRGLVKPGSSNVLCTLPQWAWPVTVKRFLAQGKNGGTVAAVPVTVSAAGVVTVNEVAGGTANVTDWLSLSGISWGQQA